jgi:thymidylate synthase
MTPEDQYINLVREVLQAPQRVTRGGAVTRAVFGKRLEFPLNDSSVPLLTTKKVFFRGIVEELLWILRGSTDANELDDKGIKIWRGHSSRAHLDSVGLHDNKEGDIGPLYGFQLRHAGATYRGAGVDYTGEGVDQIANVIESIRDDPYGRRHVVSAWSPSELPQMALSPCHCLFQFFVEDEGTALSCQLYQRSADVGLGVPFNIASYAILTRLIAACTGLEAKRFIHVMGDAHIYAEHEVAIAAQCENVPREAPVLIIKGEENLRSVQDIEKLTFEDFDLQGYDPCTSSPMKLVV